MLCSAPSVKYLTPALCLCFRGNYGGYAMLLLDERDNVYSVPLPYMCATNLLWLVGLLVEIKRLIRTWGGRQQTRTSILIFDSPSILGKDAHHANSIARITPYIFAIPFNPFSLQTSHFCGTQRRMHAVNKLCCSLSLTQHCLGNSQNFAPGGGYHSIVKFAVRTGLFELKGTHIIFT